MLRAKDIATARMYYERLGGLLDTWDLIHIGGSIWEMVRDLRLNDGRIACVTVISDCAAVHEADSNSYLGVNEVKRHVEGEPVLVAVFNDDWSVTPTPDGRHLFSQGSLNEICVALERFTLAVPWLSFVLDDDLEE